MRSTAGGRAIAVIIGVAMVALVGTGCGSDDTARTSATSSAEAPSSERSASDSSAPDESTATPSSTSPRDSGVVQKSKLTVEGEHGVEVTMTGPIAARYSSATPAEKRILGLPLTGSHNAGTRDSGVVFQQFHGGVITAKDNRPGTPAYMTYGKIRDAWNVERDEKGVPTVVGTNGSAGPLGQVTSDQTTQRHLQKTLFEHGSITYNTETDKVTVTVNGKVVPTE
ncbi:LGFP repeat-containing protein [Gordonia sp. MP11Mi]